jgi:hypothetical protein
MSRVRLILLLSLALALPAAGNDAAGHDADKEAPRLLEVEHRFALPDGAVVHDVRWASDDTVYVADYYRGVYEVELEEGLPETRAITPPSARMGVRGGAFHLAVADGDLLLASIINLASRPIDAAPEVLEAGALKRQRGYFQDIDLSGDEIVILGIPDLPTYKQERGCFVWRGELSEQLDEWACLLGSEEVAEDYGVLRRSEYAVGSLRFLPRGGFVAVPNFLPEVVLFSPSGSVKRRWTTEEIFGLRDQPDWEAGTMVEEWESLLAVRTVIDEVLPLRRGPGLLVRTPTSGAAEWRLGVLEDDVRWYGVPVAPHGSARLRGDVDEKGRIVVVTVPRSMHEAAAISSAELLVLRLPE